MKPLVVGMDLSYPPFETIGPNGKPAGISVDMAAALADYLERPLRIENIPFQGLIPALQSGRIDVIISSLTETPERAKSVLFSEPYLTTGLSLLVAKNSGIESIADTDQPGRTIAVRQGTTGETYARAHIKNAKVLALDKENLAVLEVSQGKADAFIYDQLSVFTNWRKHEDSTKVLLQPFQEEHWAIAIRRGDERLLGEVNAFLRDFRADGGFTRLAENHLSDQKKGFEELGVPFILR